MTDLNLQQIINRTRKPLPWLEGDNIPWNEPGFSERMLTEHLSQEHDHASRRTAVIDGQVGWIHAEVLGARPARILDLGCGPGLYANRLAALGHQCTGIDFSPASVAYAREHAEPGADFTLGDIRSAAYGEGYDLVMQIHGEFNVFRPADAEAVLRKAAGALKPGGFLLLEVSTGPSIRKMGEAGRDWYAAPAGLWSARPFICLEESFWDEESQTATCRHQIIDAESGAVQAYASSYQAYSEDGYRCLLERAGFTEITLLAGVGGAPPHDGYLAIIARTASQ